MLSTLFLCCFAITVRGQSITTEELRDITEAIWAADTDKIDNIEYNDNGQSPLFINVPGNGVEEGSFGLIREMRQYYYPDIGRADPACTGNCQSLRDRFLNHLIASAPIQIAHQFLVEKGLAPASSSEFRNALYQYYFTRYSRSQGAAIDSSGFEHVFYGEVRNTEVTGFHGWLQAYELEQENAFTLSNYQATCHPDIARFAFSWTYEGTTYYKSVSSVAIGATPEAEIGIYVVCFLARPNGGCPVRLDGELNTVTTYSMSGVTPLTVGTSYLAC